MAEPKKEKPKGGMIADKAFAKRLDRCHLLHEIDEVYKKEYGCSAKKYLRQRSETAGRANPEHP